MNERIFTIQSEDEYRHWLDESVCRNPNLKPLADDLADFGEDDFAKWFEVALIRIIVEGMPPERAFSPGELILGSSATDWRDELLAVIALLGESTKANAVRGLIRCFGAIAPRPTDNDVSANDGRNWEMLAVELVRLVRDLRPPLCDREATPLKALEKLLGIQFPASQAVLDEGLMVWRAFSHQIEDDFDWPHLFENHAGFRAEYAPFVAYTMAINNPTKALYYLSKWRPHRQYRGELASDMNSNDEAKSSLEELNEAANQVVRYLNVEKGYPIRYADLVINPTYIFRPLSLEDSSEPHFNWIERADAMARTCEPQSIYALLEPRGSMRAILTVVPKLPYMSPTSGIGSRV